MRKNTKKRIAIVLVALLLFVASVLGALQLGVVYTERSWTHFKPDYEKIEISEILYKTELSEEDYQTLYKQTGLTKIGVDGLLAEGRRQKIISIQEYFFKEHEIYGDHFAPFTYIEKTKGHAPFAALQDGDIIVSATTRVSWFRYGHAALVVDGRQGIIAEAFSPGSESSLNSVTTFDYLANFLILRPKVDAEVKQRVVQFAKEELVGIPYRMTTGVFSKKFNEDSLTGSQCAHLVWYAYKKFGVDLDSTGGGVVKPQDMANSEHVEVVQAFGFDLEKLWK